MPSSIQRIRIRTPLAILHRRLVVEEEPSDEAACGEAEPGGCGIGGGVAAHDAEAALTRAGSVGVGEANPPPAEGRRRRMRWRASSGSTLSRSSPPPEEEGFARLAASSPSPSMGDWEVRVLGAKQCGQVN